MFNIAIYLYATEYPKLNTDMVNSIRMLFLFTKIIYSVLEKERKTIETKLDNLWENIKRMLVDVITVDNSKLIITIFRWLSKEFKTQKETKEHVQDIQTKVNSWIYISLLWIIKLVNNKWYLVQRLFSLCLSQNKAKNEKNNQLSKENSEVRIFIIKY